MADARDNLIITVHALERFQERFPTLYTNDNDVGLFIHGECDEAMTEGRVGTVPPLELAHNDLDKWQPGKCLYAWTPNKTRGYVLQESNEGMLVTTVLVGKPTEEARRRMYTGERQRKEVA